MALSDLIPSIRRFVSGEGIDARHLNFAAMNGPRWLAAWLARRTSGDTFVFYDHAVGGDLRPTISGLTVTIAKGTLWVAGADSFDEPAGATSAIQAVYDAFKPALQPVYLAADTDVTLSTADATHPRIDVVYLTPGTTDDTAATRWVQPYSRALARPQSVNQRRTYTGTIGVTAGTPAASPTVPTIPTGSIAIAHVYVAANSTIGVVRDIRNPPVHGDGAEAIPGSGYARGVVVGTSGAVTESSPAAMTVEIAEVTTDAYGHRRTMGAATLPVEANSSGSTRYDTVYVRRYELPVVGGGDRIAIAAGSELRAPQAGVGYWDIPLAIVEVANGASSISNGEIEDVREARPLDDADAIRSMRFAPYVQAGALSGGARTITISSITEDGRANQTDFAAYLVELYATNDLSSPISATGTMTIDDPGIGDGDSIDSGTRTRDLMWPDVGDQDLVFTIQQDADVWLRVVPVVRPSNVSPTTGARNSYNLDVHTSAERPDRFPGMEQWVQLGS